LSALDEQSARSMSLATACSSVEIDSTQGVNMKSVQNLQQVWPPRLPPIHSVAIKEGPYTELVTSSEAAQVLGVGLRKFNQLRGEAWMPKPVMLGARCLRWVRSELLGAISANAPRVTKFDEPQHLQLARTTTRTK